MLVQYKDEALVKCKRLLNLSDNGFPALTQFGGGEGSDHRDEIDRVYPSCIQEELEQWKIRRASEFNPKTLNERFIARLNQSLEAIE